MKRLIAPPNNPIKALRFKREGEFWRCRYTQTDLADALGVTQGYVSKLEDGELSPTTKVMGALLKWGVPPKTIIKIIEYFSAIEAERAKGVFEEAG